VKRIDSGRESDVDAQRHIWSTDRNNDRVFYDTHSACYDLPSQVFLLFFGVV